jgi:putative ABC transport system permease protein
MIKHLFKLIWSRRKSNFLIMLEIFVAFIILFAVGSLGAYFYNGYVKPVGINTDNVWVLSVDYNTASDSVRWQSQDLLRQKIKSYGQVKTFSFSRSNIPYGFSTSNGSVEVNGKNVNSDFLSVEDSYPAVLGLAIEEGSWFKNTDTMQKSTPVVITRSLKEALFGNDVAVGKLLGKDDVSWRVVGVVSSYKHKNEFQNEDHAVFRAVDKAESTVVLKVDPSVDADFESKFAKSIQDLGKNWIVEILHMDDMKSQANSIVVIPMTILLIVCAFLIVNVMLGLFGVLFQNINRRKAEIGVRRAVGATEGGILGHFVGETLVLAAFSVLLGLFFAIQLPILKVFDVASSVYLVGILIATLGIFGLVTLCAYYPSRQAAKIQPAQALHEN